MPFKPKKMLVVWHFSCVCIINRTLHDLLEIRNFSSGVEKLMFHEVVIFEEKILYLCAEIKGKARDNYPWKPCKKTSLKAPD